MNDTVLKKNIRIAYLISIPIGFFTVLFVCVLPLTITTDEGFSAMLTFYFCGQAIIVLLSFIFAINYGSKKAHNKILKGKSLLSASFSFSFSINNIIWLTVIVITVIQRAYYYYIFSEVNSDYISNDSIVFIILELLLLPVIAYIISVIGTTFTLGLIISKIFKNNIVNYQISN